MTVDEFFSELYNDELSDLFIGNRNSREEPRAKLLPLMNTGMTYAYAKYKVQFAKVPLTVTADVSEYTLPQTDILAITRVINSHGRELEGHEVQILGQTLFFPDPVATTLTVEYKLKPFPFVEGQDDKTTPLNLPHLLIDWLRPYVASRYLAAQKTDAQVAKAKDFMNQAVTAEQVFMNTNTTNEYSSKNNTRLQGRGFA